MAEQTVDLHSHTSCSDGRLSPVGLVDLAVSKGLAALAITDHDTVAGVGPATAHAKELEIVPGVELSASEGNSDIHILGYFIDLESRLLIEHLEVFRSYRFLRGRQIVERLNELGVRLSFDDVLACSGGESASIGRPHVAQALVDNGYVGTLEEAFRIYLGSHAPAYVPKSPMSVPKAIEIIHEAGGTAVLAHPGTLKRDELIPRFVAAGLDGIEVLHPDHNVVARRYYRQLAEKYHLAVTGGTDYHGNKTRRPELGTLKIPYSCLTGLKDRLRFRSGRESGQTHPTG